MKFVKKTKLSDVQLSLSIAEFDSIGTLLVLQAVIGGQSVALYDCDGIIYKFAIDDLAEALISVRKILEIPKRNVKIILDFDDAHLYNGHYQLDTLL